MDSSLHRANNYRQILSVDYEKKAETMAQADRESLRDCQIRTYIMGQGSKSLRRQKNLSKNQVSAYTASHSTFQRIKSNSDKQMPAAKSFFFRGENNPVQIFSRRPFADRIV
jgi:hypothetical protein